MNLRFAKVRLATGPQIHYAEQGDGDGEPLVLLHGWPDSWFTFSRVLPLLPPRLRVIVPDQRGFGESERPDSGYTFDDFAADAVALLDALAIEKATIVGHSFGSFVARRTAIRRPDRVSRLFLIGTGFTGGNAVTREVRESLKDVPDPVPADFARDFQASTAYLPIPTEFFERVIAESLKLPARLWRAVIEEIVAYEDSTELARITAPTRLIWGIAMRSFHVTIRIGCSRGFAEPISRCIRRRAIARIGNVPNVWRAICRRSSGSAESVVAARCVHYCRSSAARSHRPRSAAASYVDCRKSSSVSSGFAESLTRAYGRMNSRRSGL